MSTYFVSHSQNTKFSLTLILLVTIFYELHSAEACSSRTIPKPRPATSSSSSSFAAIPITTETTIITTTTTTTTTPRPNITFPTYPCPATFDAWYCLNAATCFSVKIGESVMYNCECAIGFMGPRCEFKELDGSFLPKRPRPILEKASIASGATCALLFMLFICLTLYLRYDQKTKSLESGFNTDDEDECYLCTSKCHYCDDPNCSIYDEDNNCDLVAAAEKYRGGGSGIGYILRQHIEAIPMSFAIKRSTKL